MSTTKLRAAGLTSLNQVAALHFLHRAPAAMGVLAEHLGITTAAITGIADAMESLGLLTRIRSTRDRRIIRLTLTEAGHQLAKDTPAHAHH